MSPRSRSIAEFLAAPVLAVLCAFLANALAGPSRRLTWRGWVPPAALLPAAPPPLAPPQETPQVPAPAALPSPHPGAGITQARPLPSPVPPAHAPTDRFAPDPGAVIREIARQDAEAAFERKIPFLDARRTSDYLEGHVAGAVSLPVWEGGLEARITQWEAAAARAPRDPIVIYCGGGCEDSRLLAGKLMALGYRNLLLYKGGFPEWQEASRPTATGARP